jgi:hypothetical protein
MSQRGYERAFESEEISGFGNVIHGDYSTAGMEADLQWKDAAFMEDCADILAGNMYPAQVTEGSVQEGIHDLKKEISVNDGKVSTQQGLKKNVVTKSSM